MAVKEMHHVSNKIRRLTRKDGIGFSANDLRRNLSKRIN
jgi:hypothetical protein